MENKAEQTASFGDKIAKRIRELRKSKGLTQETLAEKANMDLTSFSRIERGKNSNIQVNTLDRIIKALEVDYATFFAFSDDENKLNQINAKLSLYEEDDVIFDIINQLLDRL